MPSSKGPSDNRREAATLTTKSGKRLLDEWSRTKQDREYWTAAIDAIEAEAVAAERARIRTAVKRENFGAMWVSRAAVLAIIDEP